MLLDFRSPQVSRTIIICVNLFWECFNIRYFHLYTRLLRCPYHFLWASIQNRSCSSKSPCTLRASTFNNVCCQFIDGPHAMKPMKEQLEESNVKYLSPATRTWTRILMTQCNVMYFYVFVKEILEVEFVNEIFLLGPHFAFCMILYFPHFCPHFLRLQKIGTTWPSISVGHFFLFSDFLTFIIFMFGKIISRVSFKPLPVWIDYG